MKKLGYILISFIFFGEGCYLKKVVNISNASMKYKTVAIYKNKRLVEETELDSNNIMLTRTFYYYHEYNNNIVEGFLANDSLYIEERKGTVLYEKYAFNFQ